MTFYGPTFPNETHYEALLTGRQRFGNRSANMFFVRPARHIACPKRLKFMHDVSTGYITYVEDSSHVNQPLYKQLLQETDDHDIYKNNYLGLCNSSEVWRQELMEMAQQVKSSLTLANQRQQYCHSPRSSRLNKHRCKRMSSSLSRCNYEEDDEKVPSKRLLYRRTSHRSPTPRSKCDEKSEHEQTAHDNYQDSGIWLIPILCYILKTDNVMEAQEWLINANPTEKRLAMELVSRTMQDMRNNESDLTSDISTSDVTSSTSNINNVYWPYKIWQQQEKEQQQQQIQNLMKESKSTVCSPFPSLTANNNEICERATSPLRMVTRVKRLPVTLNNNSTPIEPMLAERSLSRNTVDRATSRTSVQQARNQVTDRSSPIKIRPPSRNATPLTTSRDGNRPSRLGHRVATSINKSTNDDSNPGSSKLRGKTPLI